MTESASRKTALLKGHAPKKHGSWDLVVVAVVSCLVGMGLAHHYVLATMRFTRTDVFLKDNVVPKIQTTKPVSEVERKKKIEEPRGLPTNVDPSGRSGLVETTTTTTRRIVGLGPWEKVPLTNEEPSEFCESSAARLDDIILVVGGFLCDFNRVTDKVQVLNRTTGAWRTVAQLPTTAAKTHQGAAAQRSGTNPETIWLYLVSGQLGPGCTVGTTESWAVQIRKRKAVWSKLPDLPEVRYAPSAYVSRGFLHVVGGAGANRKDPRPEHWVLPLSVSGKAVGHAGWFQIDSLPDGGADSAGFFIANDYAYRLGGQHGHPRAVNDLRDNNLQCQDSPEVAHVESFRRQVPASKEARWAMTAPLPWPASHIGLSTVATDDESQVLVISGKEGKNVTKRIARYDVSHDTWLEIFPSVPFGQPDYLAWFELPSNDVVHILKFRWHPTNSTLNDDYKSITKHFVGGTRPTKRIPWSNAFTHFKATVKYEEPPSSKQQKKMEKFVFGKTKKIREDFGIQIFGVDLHDVLGSGDSSRLAAFGDALRGMLDQFGLVHFPNKKTNQRQISAKELVALHALLDHDKQKAPSTYHKGMCRLWREGLPQINLLANKAARAYSDALKDDGEPCLQNTVYGMETYAWHADEASRPADLAVRYTAFHAAHVDNNNSHGETHFASGAGAWTRLDARTKRLAASIDVKYLANPKSHDAFLPPLDVAGKRDSLLEDDGVAKRSEARDFLEKLIHDCQAHKTCDVHSSPLVVPHPRTGRPSIHLDVKQQVGFVGWDGNFSKAQAFLVDLLRPVTSADAIYHHRWKIGDVVIADNYNVLHTAAPGDAFNAKPRLIERICVPGGYVPSKVSWF